MFPGRILMGVGFVAFAVTQDLWSFMLIAPIAAFGSSAGDLPFLALMQRHFHVTQLGRVFGLRGAIEAMGGGAGALIAVPFIALTSPDWLVAASGLGAIVFSAFAIWRTRREVAMLAVQLPRTASRTSVAPGQ
jgi:hypothetical protein